MNKLEIYSSRKNLTNYTNWLKRQGLATKTINGYLEGIKHFQNSSSNKLTLTNLMKFFRERVKKLAVNTIVNRQTALKSFAKWQRLKLNWLRIGKLIPKSQSRYFDTLNFSDLTQLKQTAISVKRKLNERNNLILEFLLYSGLRLTELVNVKHSHWQGNSLRIWGKGNKVRYVFLSPWLTKYFQPNSDDYLFTNQSGQQISKRTVQKIIREKVKQSGLNKVITTHSFRRSFATLLNNNGTALTTISKLMGHSHITTTANYIHNDQETLYNDYSKLWKNQPNLTTF